MNDALPSCAVVGVEVVADVEVAADVVDVVTAPAVVDVVLHVPGVTDCDD